MDKGNTERHTERRGRVIYKSMLLMEVASELNVPIAHVKKIFSAIHRKIIEHLEKGDKIVIPGLVTFIIKEFPPYHKDVKLNGGIRHIRLPARYSPRAKISPELAKKLMVFKENESKIENE